MKEYDLVALFLDGKTFAADTMVIALGVTVTGEKVLATALLDIEPRPRRVRAYKHLPALRRALQAYTQDKEQERLGKPTPRKKAA